MDWAEIYTGLAADREDARAWAAVERRVCAWARREFGSRGWHAVEDLVADTCAEVAVGFGRARGAATFAGFVAGHYLNVRRRRLRTVAAAWLAESLDGVDVPAPSSYDPDRPDVAQRARLREALEGLPERERRAVVLKYYEERSGAEIGAVLGVTEANARRIVCDAVARLRRRLRAAPGAAPLRPAQPARTPRGSVG